jgi:hypothetical protein
MVMRFSQLATADELFRLNRRYGWPSPFSFAPGSCGDAKVTDVVSTGAFLTNGRTISDNTWVMSGWNTGVDRRRSAA